MLFCEYVLSLPMDKKELARQRAKEWYAANKEKAAQTAKEYAEKNKEALREYRKKYHEKNKEEYNSKRKKAYQENPEHAEKARQVSRNYFNRNPELIKARQEHQNKVKKEKYVNNPEYREKAKARVKATREKYKKENPELLKQKERIARQKAKENGTSRTNAANYRARKRKAFIETVSFKKLYERDKGVCHICKGKTTTEYVDGGQPSNYATIDHVIPLVMGGLHCYENTKIACKSCNSAKSGNIPKDGIQMDLFAQPGLRKKDKSPTIDLPPDERKKAWARKYNEKNRESVNASNRARRAANKAAGKKEYKPSPEKSKQYSAEYRERHREAINKRRRENRLAKKLK